MTEVRYIELFGEEWMQAVTASDATIEAIVERFRNRVYLERETTFEFVEQVKRDAVALIAQFGPDPWLAKDSEAREWVEGNHLYLTLRNEIRRGLITASKPVDLEDLESEAGWKSVQQWIDDVAIHQRIWTGEDTAGRTCVFVSKMHVGFECALARLGLMLRYNQRAQRPELRWSWPDGRRSRWEPMTDRNEAMLNAMIERSFSFVKGSSEEDDTPRSIPAHWTRADWDRNKNATLYRHQIDPFMEWAAKFDAWDGVKRLDYWLRLCGFKFADEEQDWPLIKWAARSILMVAVWRALEPGKKHDTIPVLIGPQGCGKSTSIAMLFPARHSEEWFTDSLTLGGDSKRRLEAIQGAVIVEISEMTGATTAQIEHLRSFLSRTVDKERLAYRHNPEGVPRMCSMVGTANGTAVLPNDPTGNRRFVSIRITEGSPTTIRNWLNANREQLWAEAFVRVRAGETCHFTSDMSAIQSEVNETVRSGDAVLEDEILAWVRSRMLAHPRPQYIVASECVREVLVRRDEKVGSIPQSDVRRVTRVLERLGCQATRTIVDGVRRRVWVLPDRLPGDPSPVQLKTPTEEEAT